MRPAARNLDEAPTRPAGPTGPSAKRQQDGPAPKERPGATALRVGKDAAWLLLSQAAQGIALLALVPFLLGRLGPERYGLVSTFSTTLLFFTMLDIGLGRAATWSIARCIAGGLEEEAKFYFWGASIFLLGLGCALGLTGLAATHALVYHWLRVPQTLRPDALLSFRLIFGVLPVITVAGTFRGFLEATGRFAATAAVSMTGGAGSYIAAAGALLLGGGLIAVAAAFCAMRVLACAGYLAACVRRPGGPGLRPALKATAFREMLKFGGWLSASNVAGLAMAYGDRFAIAAWIGMSAVTAYSLPLDIFGRLQVAAASICTVLFPLLSKLDVAQKEDFEPAYRLALAATAAVMVPLGAYTAAAARPLLSTWVGDAATPGAVFAAQVFAAGLPLQAFASLAWTALHARGRSDLTALAHLVELPAFFGALYLVCPRFGVQGAALVWLARVALDFLLIAVFLRASLATGLPLPREAWAVAIAALALLAARHALLPAIGCASLVIIAAWACCWGWLLNTQQRAWCRTRLTNAIAR